MPPWHVAGQLYFHSIPLFECWPTVKSLSQTNTNKKYTKNKQIKRKQNQSRHFHVQDIIFAKKMSKNLHVICSNGAAS
jgi:hypothetical protein